MLKIKRDYINLLTLLLVIKWQTKNTLLNADEIYMDVEGESGQQLELEDDQRS